MAQAPNDTLRQKIRENVERDYKSKYPQLTAISIPSVVLEKIGGHFALVKWEAPNEQYEEICFVRSDLEPEIADSDRHLLDILIRQIQEPTTLERIFSKNVISGAVFLLVVISLFFSFYANPNNKEILAIIGSIAGAAGGFFFGSQKTTAGQ